MKAVKTIFVFALALLVLVSSTSFMVGISTISINGLSAPLSFILFQAFVTSSQAASDLCHLQSQAVRHHAHRAQGHRSAGNHRV